MGHDGHDHDHDHEHGHKHAHQAGHDHGPSAEHKAHAPASVSCFVITSSDSRTPESDDSGKLLRELLTAAGHTLAGQALVKDDPAQLKQAIEGAVGAGARAILISGGTGIGRRDTTFETVSALLEKRLDGFGELFRMLSYEEIGSAAMLSRAVAGTFRGAIVFALPGSPGAARLGLEKLILPELGHAVRELSR